MLLTGILVKFGDYSGVGQDRTALTISQNHSGEEKGWESSIFKLHKSIRLGIQLSIDKELCNK